MGSELLAVTVHDVQRVGAVLYVAVHQRARKPQALHVEHEEVELLGALEEVRMIAPRSFAAVDLFLPVFLQGHDVVTKNGGELRVVEWRLIPPLRRFIVDEAGIVGGNACVRGVLRLRGNRACGQYCARHDGNELVFQDCFPANVVGGFTPLINFRANFTTRAGTYTPLFNSLESNPEEAGETAEKA